MKTIFHLFFAFFLFLPSTIEAQEFTTKGTDFWFAFMDNIGSSVVMTAGNKRLLVFISSDTDNSGTVEVPGLYWSENFTVNANSVVEIVIPVGAEIEATQAIEDLGVHVTTAAPASVYALNYFPNSSDATIVYPTPSLGNEYYNLTYTTLQANGSQNPSLMMLVGVEDNTLIEITPSVTTSKGNAAGVPFTVTLNAGDTYMLANTNPDEDISGTYVRSLPSGGGDCMKDFAVFGGHFCANVPVEFGFCDHLFEQLPPTDKWGKSFVTVPLKTREKDIFRVLASRDNTTVNVGGMVVNLNKGEVYEVTLTATPIFIEASDPVLVAQYSVGGNVDNVIESDPFMILINPVEQVIKEATFTVFNSLDLLTFYLNVVVETAQVNETFLDGINLSSTFNVVAGNPTYSYAQVEISPGGHSLTNNNSGFISYVYGYGSQESYGYVAGTGLDPINNGLNGFNIVDNNLDSTFYLDFVNDTICQGDFLDFVAFTGNPEILDYVWDFGGGVLVNGPQASQVYNDPGTFDVLLTLFLDNGCEEELETSFTIIEEETEDTIIVCQGDTILGVPIFKDTLLCNTFTSIHGCNLTRCFNVIMGLGGDFNTQSDTTICQGDTIYGNPITISGLICDDFTSSLNGCDSTHCYMVSVIFPVNIQKDTVVCQGATIVGLEVFADTLFCNTYIGPSGCDSTHCFDIKVEDLTFNEFNSTICDGESYPFDGSFYTESGQYVEDLVPSGDCKPIDIVNLKVLPSFEDNQSIIICEGESYQGHTSSGLYTDTIISDSSCVVSQLDLEVEEIFQVEIIEDYTCPCSDKSSIYPYEESGLYIIDTVLNENGCEVIQAVNFTNYSVYIPNAFSPNGDGINDEFRVYTESSIGEVTIEYLGIFDRWGGTILEKNQELLMNKPLWDGTRGVEDLNEGVYVYAIKLRCPATNSSFVCRGDITLIK